MHTFCTLILRHTNSNRFKSISVQFENWLIPYNLSVFTLVKSGCNFCKINFFDCALAPSANDISDDRCTNEGKVGVSVFLDVGGACKSRITHHTSRVTEVWQGPLLLLQVRIVSNSATHCAQVEARNTSAPPSPTPSGIWPVWWRVCAYFRFSFDKRSLAMGHTCHVQTFRHLHTNSCSNFFV